MNIYKVIKDFTDLEDENQHVYREGKIFPHEAVIISEERIAALSTADNKRGEPLIELLAEAKEPEVANTLEKQEIVEVNESPEAISEAVEKKEPKKKATKKAAVKK